MNYDEIKAEISDEYEPKVLYENVKTNKSSQTKVIIKQITQKNIMPINNLAYNLSKRFSFYDADFNVELKDLATEKNIKIDKSIYFEKFDKEFEWIFPYDFEEKFGNEDWFIWLKEHKVTGEIFTKKHL